MQACKVDALFTRRHARRFGVVALDVCQPAHGLGHDIVAEVAAVGTVKPKGGHGEPHQTRIRGSQPVQVDSPGRPGVGAFRAYDHVGARGELAKTFLVPASAEVEHHAAFVHVGAHEVQAEPLGALAQERHGAAPRIPLRRLDLDDVGTQVGKKAADQGTQRLGDFQNAKAVQHAGGLCALHFGDPGIIGVRVSFSLLW